MKRYIFYVLAVLSVTVGGGSNASSQDKTKVLAPPSAQTAEKMRDWQKIEPAGTNITFRIPTDWKKQTSLTDDETVMVNSNEQWKGWWNSQSGFLSVTYTNFAKGFPSSLEEMLRGNYECLTLSKSEFNVEYLRLGGMEGIYQTATLDKNTRERVNSLTRLREKFYVYWRGFREFEGKSQRFEITMLGFEDEKEILEAVLQSFETTRAANGKQNSGKRGNDN